MRKGHGVCSTRRVPLRVVRHRSGWRRGSSVEGRMEQMLRAVRAVRVRHRAGTARLRPVERTDDLDCPHQASRGRPGTSDRLALPQPRRPGRFGRRLRTRRRARALHRTGERGSCPVRPRRLRSARDRAQHGAALLWQPQTVGRLLHAVRFPVDARGGADLGRGRPVSGRQLRQARRQHRGAHVDGERRA